jgi:hypothetical protein
MTTRDMQRFVGKLAVTPCENNRGAYLDTPKTKLRLRTLKLSDAVMTKFAAYRECQVDYASNLGDKRQEGGRVFTNWCGEPMYTNVPELRA